MMGSNSRRYRKRLYRAMPIRVSHGSRDCSGWSATFRLTPTFRPINQFIQARWWTP